MARLALQIALVITALTLVPGCGDGGPAEGTDDAGRGGGVDAGPGGGMDSGTGGEMDSGPGGGSDGGTMMSMGRVGDACSMASDCTEPSGARCETMVGMAPLGYTFPGGYCTAMCTAGSGSAECGEGADCFTLGFGGFGTSFCARTCTGPADCRVAEGYSCQRPPIGGGTTMYCLPPTPGIGGDGAFTLPDGSFSFPDGGGFGIPDGGGFGRRDGSFSFPDGGGFGRRDSGFGRRDGSIFP